MIGMIHSVSFDIGSQNYDLLLGPAVPSVAAWNDDDSSLVKGPIYGFVLRRGFVRTGLLGQRRWCIDPGLRTSKAGFERCPL